MDAYLPGDCGVRTAQDRTDGQELLDCGGQTGIGTDGADGLEPGPGRRSTAVSTSLQGSDPVLLAQLLSIDA